MTAIHKSAIVPYTAEQMFALVENINDYPQFLPWCKNAQVLIQRGAEVEASITLARGTLEKTFTTTNTLRKNEAIEMRLLRGPFSRLHGQWRFQALGNGGCKVSLDMHFEFSNHLLRLTVGPVFTQIVNALIDAFIKRAVDLYGKHPVKYSH